MRFLFDENMPRSFPKILRALGYNAIHVSDVGLISTKDRIIVSFAEKTGDVMITFDLDFTTIVATENLPFPSVITFRLPELNQTDFQFIMSQHLESLLPALEKGALITINERGIRIRYLPVRQ
jgi:predicted nuclease of predicted toxin-antitoxin system